MRFAAANISSDSESDAETLERQELESKARYQEALRSLQQGLPDQAKEQFESLLDLLPQDRKSSEPDDAILALAYLCRKHIGQIERERGSNDPAVRWLLSALEIDAGDAMVWHSLGRAAEDCDQWLVARAAYQQAERILI